MTKKNFRILEGCPPKFLERYDEFIELYFNPDIKKKDILKILDWSDGQYKKARAKAVEEGLIGKTKPRGRGVKNPKYHYYDRKLKRYVVSRDTKRIHIYHICNSKQEAIELVAYLNKYGWTKKNIKQFKKEVI